MLYDVVIVGFGRYVSFSGFRKGGAECVKNRRMFSSVVSDFSGKNLDFIPTFLFFDRHPLDVMILWS